MKWLIMSFTLLSLSACSMFPDEIATENEAALVDYAQATANPQQTVGQSARWGGVIADVRNGKDFTIIEMVNFPLKSWGRPIVKDQTNGRYLVLIDGFVDPAVYKKGRSLTVLGTLEAPQKGKIGEYTYLYPVIKASGYHLWEKEVEQLAEIDYAPLWFRHNFYSPYYPYPYRVVPVRVQKQPTQKSTKN